MSATNEGMRAMLEISEDDWWALDADASCCWRDESKGCVSLHVKAVRAFAERMRAALDAAKARDGTTHWEGCWREHHECAIAEVERWRQWDDA